MTSLAAVALGGVALYVAGRLQWLTASGLLAAALVGLAVLLGSGALGVALLLVFFLSSSLLSRFRAAHKSGSVEPSGRSARQVVANGGVPAALSLAALAGWVPEAHYALVGALAAATADTWATEIGSAGRWATWSILGLGRVVAGRSGGVSVPGTLAAIAGAAVIGVVTASLAGTPVGADAGMGVGMHVGVGVGAEAFIRLAAVAGTAGMLVDSLLGATLEDRMHVIGNDEVNLGCTLAGAGAALMLHGAGW